MKKLYIIAGEPSGDFLGSSVIQSLNESSDFEIYGVGGNLMEAAGLKSLFDIREISIGGLIEIVPHIFHIKNLINRTVDDIIAKNPDILLTIDSPGFCFRVAKRVRKKNQNIKLIHLVAPSVWAWREGRAKSMSKLYDHLLTLFDFEPKYFTKFGLETTFVGHPAVEYFEETDNTTKENTLLILPGSRKQEINALLPIFLKASEKLNFEKIIIPTLSNLLPIINPIIKNCKDIKLVCDEKEKAELYKSSKLAIVASGTATLQLALAGCPMIVCYRLSFVTYQILKHFVKVNYISLVNLILNKAVVPELIQSECNVEKILNTTQRLSINTQIKEFKELRERLKPIDGYPSQKISDILKRLGRTSKKP